MNWDEKRADELNSLATSGRTVILPIGSTEQHGPHLPVGTDTMLCSAIAARAAERSPLNTVVLPALWISLAEHHMDFPGTLTLNHAELTTIVSAIVRSVVRQGFGKIVLLNGHGGNMSALPGIADTLSRETGASVVTGTYWMIAAKAFAEILEGQENLRHACEAETSMMMELYPELVDMNRATNAEFPGDFPAEQSKFHQWKSFREITPSGVVGDLRHVSAEKGSLLLAAAADALVRALDDL